MNNLLLFFSQISQNVVQIVTVEIYRSPPHKATSLMRNEPDREVGSLNRKAPPLQQAPVGAGAGACTCTCPCPCTGAGAGGAGAGGAGAGGAGAGAYDSYEYEQELVEKEYDAYAGENGHMVRQKKFLLSILLERY